MVSWSLHIKWAELFGVPRPIAERVNEVIDAKYGHDLGLLKTIYVPVILPIILSSPIYRGVKVPTVEELAEVLIKEFKNKNDLTDAVVAAILHHFMDVLALLIKRRGKIVLKNPEGLIEEAVNSLLKHQLPRIELLCRVPGTFKAVKDFILMNAKAMLKDILDELESKGIVLEIGIDTFTKIFCEWASATGIRVVHFIKSHSEVYPYVIPSSAAARKIYSILRKGEEVMFQVNSKTYRFKDINDALNTMLIDLEKYKGISNDCKT